MKLAALALCALTAPAFAQDPNCAPVADALAGLAQTYGEAPRATAMMGAHVLVITASPSGGWTALEVKPTGEACIVASRENFEVVALPAPGDDT